VAAVVAAAAADGRTGARGVGGLQVVPEVVRKRFTVVIH